MFDPTIIPMYATTTGKLTSATQIMTTPGALIGCLINTDASNAATLELYDGVSTAGNLLWDQTVLGGDITGGGFPLVPLKFNKLYAKPVGTGAEYIVHLIYRGM